MSRARIDDTCVLSNNDLSPPYLKMNNFPLRFEFPAMTSLTRVCLDTFF